MRGPKRSFAMDPIDSSRSPEKPIPPEQVPSPIIDEREVLPKRPPVTIAELTALLQAGKIEEFNALRPRAPLIFKGIEFNRAIMDRAELQNCVFESCDFRQCSFVNAELKNAEFRGCALMNTHFDGAVAPRISFERCALVGVHFKHTDLFSSRFKSNDIWTCVFEQSWLELSSFQCCVLNACELSQVSGKNARFEQSRLVRTNFCGSDLEKSAFVQTHGDLINFTGANLVEAVFNGSWWQEGFSVVNAYVSAGALQEHMFSPRVWDQGGVLKQAHTEKAPPKGRKFGSLKIGIDTIKTLVDGIPGTDKKLYDEAMGRLHNLVGLDEVKREVEQLAATLRVARHRELQGAEVDFGTLHYVFTGPSGTGKTTVARIFGDILKSLGYLSKGHFIETDRSGLVGRYLGETGIKTRTVVEEAVGGVLFIDEAYTLAPNNEHDQYAQEALATLLKLMEDLRHNLVVIVAGYEREMEQFIRANPGLQSRFANSLRFEDLPQGALAEVAKSLMTASGFTADETTLKGVSTVLSLLRERERERFGNGRTVRNIYEKMLRRQAVRLTKAGGDLARAKLNELTFEDIPCQEMLKITLAQLHSLLEQERVSDFEQGLEALFKARWSVNGGQPS